MRSWLRRGGRTASNERTFRLLLPPDVSTDNGTASDAKFEEANCCQSMTRKTKAYLSMKFQPIACPTPPAVSISVTPSGAVGPPWRSRWTPRRKVPGVPRPRGQAHRVRRHGQGASRAGRPTGYRAAAIDNSTPPSTAPPSPLIDASWRLRSRTTSRAICLRCWSAAVTGRILASSAAASAVSRRTSAPPG
jgi:hypothetical protein